MRTSNKIIRVCLILIAAVLVLMCVVSFWFYDLLTIKEAIIEFASNFDPLRIFKGGEADAPSNYGNF